MPADWAGDMMTTLERARKLQFSQRCNSADSSVEASLVDSEAQSGISMVATRATTEKLQRTTMRSSQATALDARTSADPRRRPIAIPPYTMGRVESVMPATTLSSLMP